MMLACSSEIESHAEHQRMTVEVRTYAAAVVTGLQLQMGVSSRKVAIIEKQFRRIADRQAGACAHLPGKHAVVLFEQPAAIEVTANLDLCQSDAATNIRRDRKAEIKIIPRIGH